MTQNFHHGTTMDKVNQALEAIGSKDAYIHRRVVSFEDPGHKTRIGDQVAADLMHRDTFRDLFRHVKGGAKHYFALFSTHNTSLKSEFEAHSDEAWYSWAAVILNCGKDRILLIWDCNPKASINERSKTLDMLPMQRRFVTAARERYPSISEVWYNIDDTEGGDVYYLQSSLNWVRKMAGLSNSELESMDKKEEGFVRLILSH